ncbi:dihydropteroate synthase [Campylobacter sp. CCUG 57310]|uniref:dihydropteroate synthase n=1 Tax=Campylobacter sp. CCUG 57310 TaxID=2517362 RepID=UPI001566EE43|nr:dihydropteroate synthase [Campylobacter sp. CCUG 57310]QKF92437.1 dihydropteroate synthase [Campylobacter sp. CCUG 57310]
MKIFKINQETNFDEICKFISPSKEGQAIMKKKANLNFFLLKDIRSPAANILKQDALSIGAELVTHKNTILNGENSTALLIATDTQIKELAKKEAAQDFGLKNLAKFLKSSFKKPARAEIMGVVNVNEDSFNEQSRVDTKSGIKKIEEMIEDGAEYIDVGAVSSRPGSKYVGAKVEFERLKDIVAEIYRLNLHEKAKFSLDSFDEYCLEYALNHGFKMINDITADTNLASLAVKYGVQYCLMHMQNSPENMQDSPYYDDLLGEIDSFFADKITKVRELGCEDIVLDVGIGFGKTPQDNLLLIKHLEHFLHFGLPLLVGASRKSVINFYSPSEVSKRLPGSLYLHQKAFENGASIIRTHDVSEHVQMFKMDEAMRNLSLWSQNG